MFFLRRRLIVVALLFLCALGSIGPTSKALAYNILDGPLQLEGTISGGPDDWENIFNHDTEQKVLLDYSIVAPVEFDVNGDGEVDYGK